MMKRAFIVMVGISFLSAGSAQAFQFHGLGARLSLDRPYSKGVYPPVEGANRIVSFRQVENPTRFNIFRYVHVSKEGLKLAVYFK
jgi:hypothetical protein